MKKEELLVYEMPTVAEYISVGWIQSLIARYVARKLNHKIERYNIRVARKALLEAAGLITKQA